MTPGEAPSGGLPEPEDPLAPWPSAGCGRAPGQALRDFVRYQVQTSGTKAADASGTPGAWSYEREYFVSLPPEYEPSKAHPLVIESPGCGESGKSVYALKTEGGVIRVGLSPPPAAIGSASHPEQQCFDVAEGDDSVEWPFYEAVMNELNARFCYDRHRVWAAGIGSGALLTNELACKYAGNRAGFGIRGVVTLGGLPTDPAAVPTCSGKPLAGMWVGDTNNRSRPFEELKLAVTRAIQVNVCNGSSSYDDALYKDFPIPNRSWIACKQVMACPEAYPLVFCAIPGDGHSSHDDFILPGFDKLVQMLAAP